MYQAKQGTDQLVEINGATWRLELNNGAVTWQPLDNDGEMWQIQGGRSPALPTSHNPSRRAGANAGRPDPPRTEIPHQTRDPGAQGQLVVQPARANRGTRVCLQLEAAAACGWREEELCPGPTAAIDEGDKVRAIYDGSKNTREPTTAPTPRRTGSIAPVSPNPAQEGEALKGRAGIILPM